MKTYHIRDRREGKILIVTLVLALLVALAVGALLMIARNQSTLTARSQVWASEMAIAEAGIEEAMAHVNSRAQSWATNGWTNTGSKFVKSRPFAGGYYYTEIGALKPPVIRSYGYGRVPLQTNFTSRVIFARTANNPPPWGFVARTSITLGGTTALIDSFDSSSELYSTGGLYDPNKRLDRAGVGTLSSANPAINTGTARIYGSVGTSPGGTAVGNVGDGLWNSTSSGIQPGHFFDDFNMAIPDATLPTGLSASSPTPSSGIVSSSSYNYVLGNGNYYLSSLNMNGPDMVVTGKAKLYIAGSLKMTGSGAIVIKPGGTLELVLGGDMDVGAHGIVNEALTANSCLITGLPTCTSIKYSGSAALTARIYAPNADIRMGGTTEFCGSMVGNRLEFQGTPAVHYDEAIGAEAIEYRVSSWEEL